MREAEAKTVIKPWGKEIWLELNDRYCYKRIYINKGHKTSLQYHEKKLETNYIIDGEAELWLQDSSGDVFLEKDGVKYTFFVTKMGRNDFFTIKPKIVHRIKALTDIVLQEVSSPEIDDVIRIKDDTGRCNGRIEAEHKNEINI